MERFRLGSVAGRAGSAALMALRATTRSPMFISRPLFAIGRATVNVLPTDATSASRKLVQYTTGPVAPGALLMTLSTINPGP